MLQADKVPQCVPFCNVDTAPAEYLVLGEAFPAWIRNPASAFAERRHTRGQSRWERRPGEKRHKWRSVESSEDLLLSGCWTANAYLEVSFLLHRVLQQQLNLIHKGGFWKLDLGKTGLE